MSDTLAGVSKAAERRVEQKHSEETPKKMPELLRGVGKAAEKRREQKLEQESATPAINKRGRRNAIYGALP